MAFDDPIAPLNAKSSSSAPVGAAPVGAGAQVSKAAEAAPVEKPADVQQKKDASTGIQAKNANYELGTGWESVARADDIQARQAADPTGTAGTQRPDYPMNGQDNMENRELKAEYAGVNSLVSGMKPDPKKYENAKTDFKDGMFTTREDSSDGAWREYTYSDDRTKVTYKDSTGREYYKDGDTLVYRNTNNNSEFLFGMGENGDVFKSQRAPDGAVSTKIAAADGSYRELNGAGDVTKQTAANPDMARYDALAAKMGASIGGDGKQAALNDEQKYILGGALSRFDPATIENLEKSGVKIRIVDEKNPPPGGYPGGRQEWLEGGQGYYTLKEKTLVFKQSDYQNGGNIVGYDTAHHELGHAIDDMLAPDSATRVNDVTEKDPKFNQMFEDYKKRIEADPSQTWSRYAATNAQEYFAEGVLKYTGGDKQKAQLQGMDPGLYKYVEEMLNQSKDSALPGKQKEQPAPAFPGGGFFPTFPGGGAGFPMYPGAGFPTFPGGGGFPTFPGGGGGFPTFPGGGGGFPTFPGGGGGFPSFPGGDSPVFPTVPWQPGSGMGNQQILQQVMMMRQMQMMQQMMQMMMLMMMMGNPMMGFGMMPMMF